MFLVDARILSRGSEVVGTYVISEAAMVKKKRALRMMRPERPDARRLKGATRAAKNPRTLKMRPIR